ncbi:NAD(P)/FAD-dependent oxidoreductase [Peristeroidobacter soli]|jgi:glycine/D-amino acid oxidase-like deaminating enzyme|uniref:NAD(P)/FAD-dependent oxidoreductase n=1 Tax=Peristeroidobacter soli TaxID=2497877 RepID=UPI0013002DAB|nr:FAD-binding oxidoreductase [Peristeroidobacter soli]
MRALSLYPHIPDDVLARIGPRPSVFPKSADVVIVGGGIMGSAAAYYLAKAGVDVVLVEKDKVAAQQSGRNWGFVRTQYRDPAELPLAVEALSLWPTLEQELGSQLAWRRTGCIFLAQSEAELEQFEQWLNLTCYIATDARMLSGREVAALMPALRVKAAGALYTRSDGQAEPGLATTAFARAAESLGAQILEDCGALAIDASAGAITGVLTEHGFIRSNMVICAAGAHSHRLLGKLDLFLPQQVVRSTVSLTSPAPMISEACFCGYGLGLRQRPDGSCIVAAESLSDVDLTLDSMRSARYFIPELLRNWRTFSFRFGRPFIDDLHRRLTLPKERLALEPRRPLIAPNRKRAANNVGLFHGLFGGAHDVAIVKSWAGQIDVLPDALPVIDTPAAVRGLIVATGFSGHGFGLGPAVGKNVATLAMGATPNDALKPLRLERFALGEYGRSHAPL